MDFDKVPCIKGCSECCGPFPLSPKELSAIEDYMAPLGMTLPDLMPGTNMRTDAKNLDCAFLSGGRCSVYSVRPLICRGMGSVNAPSLICHEHNVRARRLMPVQQFNKLINKAGY